MKCGNCGEEVEIKPGKSSNFCSNCGNKIEVEKSGDWKYFDNTKELLAYVAAEYGNDALFGRKYFTDHSSPMMPQGQKNLVKQAFECGAVKVLQDNVNSDQAHKEIAVKQAVRKLEDTYASAKEAAERVIWEFTNAIGWGMPEPQYPIPSKTQHVTNIKTPSQPARIPATPVSNAVTRGMIFLEDGDVAKAHEYFEKALDEDPFCSAAYLGNLLVKLNRKSIEELKQIPYDVSEFKEYKRALAYANNDERISLEEIQKSTLYQAMIYKFVFALKQIRKKKAR